MITQAMVDNLIADSHAENNSGFFEDSVSQVDINRDKKASTETDSEEDFDISNLMLNEARPLRMPF